MRRPWLALTALIALNALLVPAPGSAQVAPPAPVAVATSPGPDDVSISIYRAPDRRADRAIDADEGLAGYALVTERRTVTLPAGRSVLRFEGVAGNILPESAIVADLPRDVIEKNLDADLLSPRSLYDRMLGRRVVIRRTDRATGRTIEQQATIRSAADGAAVLEIAGRYEALGCTGLRETLVYPGIPEGLSARPTLSIRTDSPRAVTATLTLSYLAGGFDWQADYVATMRADGQGADLFAWVTLASSDVTSFARAQAQVIAGKLNRVARDGDEQGGERGFGTFADADLRLQCYPTGARYASFPPPPPPPPPMMASPMAVMDMAEDIVVTGARVARQEELGDLKLYRFPDRVTVASQAQKQVGLLAREKVAFRAIYVSDLQGGGASDPRLVLRVANTPASGLGVPLPAGPVAVFQEDGARRLLIGTSSTEDKAIGEHVELKLPAGPGVSVEVADRPARRRRDGHLLTVTNANPWPIEFEAKLGRNDDEKLHFRQKLIRRDGRYIWATTVPANATATFDYEVESIG